MTARAGWQRLGAEFVGTAILVFIGVGSIPSAMITNGAEPFTAASLGVVSLAFATAVIATVYVFGWISGNHINPAVTVALATMGRFPWRDVPGYLAAQTLGACAGAAAIVGTLGLTASDVGLGIASYSGIPVWQAFTAEFMGTFVLVLTVFGVIHRRAAPGFGGLAIGLVVFAAIIPVAPATGAAINPARTSGPMLIQQVLGGTVQWEQWPVYVAAQLLAGIAAGAVFTALARTPEDRTVEATVAEQSPATGTA